MKKSNKMRNVQWEAKEQAALFQWASHYPKLRNMHATLNGAFLQGDAKQRAIRWKQLQCQGARKGVLDVFLPLPIPPYHGMWIEMKRADGKGRITQEQEDFGVEMELQGYKVVFCNGWIEARSEIAEYAKLNAIAEIMK